jgi:hypothetical protein
MSDTITIDGLADLSTMLTDLTPRAAKRYLSRVAQPAAQVVLDAMVETVPVASGALAAHLGFQRKWGNEGDETTLNIEIGPIKGYTWGSMQEFGTVHQPATHWFSHAWMASRDKCLNVFSTGAIGLLQDLENKKG